jgi:N-acetylmuramoyl-L-alanine amidase
MTSFNRYQSTLSTYNQRLGTADFRNTAPTVEGEYNAKFTSALGQDVGQTLNGFQSMTMLQNYNNELKGVILGLALVKLTEAVTGEDLFEVIDDAFTGIGSGHADVPDVLTALGTLAILTGESPVAGFLKSYYGGSSGLAIGTLLSKATGKDITSLVSVIQGVHSAGNIKDFVRAGLSRSLGSVLSPIISDFNSKVDLAIGDAISPVLQAVMDISAGPIGLIIDDLTGGRLKTFENYNVVRLLSEGRYAEAILFVSNNSDSPFNFIEETLLGIDTRVSSRITYTGSTQLPTLSKIGENDNKWEGANTSTWKDPDQGSTAYPNSPPPGTFTVTSESQANSIFQNPNSTAVERAAAQGFYRSGAVTSTNVPTGITVTSESQANSILQNPNATETERQAAREYYGAASAPASDGAYKFSRVGGVEELEAEFRSATRDITEVVVHWTAHFLNQDIGAEEIHSQHKTDGWSGIGYHYVIRKDGTIERGRPLQKRGAHAKANGHNKYSIGVAFVGGYTVNSNSGLANPPYGVESINSEQVKALRRFMSTFYKVWPGGQAWGHNDTDPQRKPDPGFSVPQFVRSNFGKENASLSGTTPPLTPEEIAAQRREGS